MPENVAVRAEVDDAPAGAPEKRRSLRDLLLLLSPAILMFVIAGSTARFHWGAESYYNFGWAVPFLGAFLFYRRLKDLPEPQSPSLRTQYVCMGLMVLLALLLVPARLVGEVNVIWRVPIIIQGGAAMLVALLGIFTAGGRAWLKHLWFPCVFLLTMFPWPYRLEFIAVDTMTSLVTSFSEISLQFLGYPALAQGNTIRVGDAMIGVDDACSGIRSLQVLVMASLFLGEFFRISWVRRIILVALTIGVVLSLNSLRSLILSLIVIESGSEAYDKWHDNVGIFTFLPSLVLVYVFGELLAFRKPDPDPVNRLKLPVLPKPRLIALPVVAVLLGAALVEGWFRYHEIKEPETADWAFQWRSIAGREHKPLEISRIVLDQLGCDFATRGAFLTPDGKYAEVYVYGYDGENKITAISSYVHSPKICMGAVGANLEQELAPLQISVQNLSMPLRHFVFSPGEDNVFDAGNGISRTLHVFWHVSERQNMGIDPDRLISSVIDYKLIWEQTLKGRRSYDRKVILVSVAGVASTDEARDVARKLLEDHLTVTEHPRLASATTSN